MAYNSIHTGPEIDAAVTLLGDIQDARDATAADRLAVEEVAPQVASNAQIAANAVATTTGDRIAAQQAAQQAQASATEVSGNTTEAQQAAQQAVEMQQLAEQAAQTAERDANTASQRAIEAEQHADQVAQDAVISQQARDEAVQSAADLGAAVQTATGEASKAKASADAAAAVVTGGTASLTPEPGKIPLADGEGKIDLQWLGSDVVDKINSLSAYFIPTPTPTPDNFGDPLEGGFYAGMIWNCIALSSDSRSISLGRADFNVDTTDHLVYFGQMIEVRSISNPRNKFTGTVIGASIGRISLDVTEIGGSGTHSDWAVMSRFRSIVAPKAQGESAQMMLKLENTAMPPETQTLTEGWKATNAMVAAGSAEEYPAAHWARSLMINGYSDFYIPARDELELQWRNLKPEDIDNYDPDGLRGLSGINYQKDGAYGDVVRGRGLNLNSYPQGSTYTLTDPGQTAAVAFQTGGAEANAWDTTFWSSSEYSAAGAWLQYWSVSYPGHQLLNGKTNPRSVRAVRRSII